MQSVSCQFVALGDSAVGKTCLLSTYKQGRFLNEYDPTGSDNNCLVNLAVDGTRIKLCLWDTADNGDSLKSYGQVHLFIVCFSLVNPDSFENVRAKWHRWARRCCPDSPIILVGTKLDLRECEDATRRLQASGRAPITREQGAKMASVIGAKKYIECSARKPQDVDSVFREAVRASYANFCIAKGRRQGCVPKVLFKISRGKKSKSSPTYQVHDLDRDEEQWRADKEYSGIILPAPRQNYHMEVEEDIYIDADASLNPYDYHMDVEQQPPVSAKRFTDTRTEPGVGPSGSVIPSEPHLAGPSGVQASRHQVELQAAADLASASSYCQANLVPPKIPERRRPGPLTEELASANPQQESERESTDDRPNEETLGSLGSNGSYSDISEESAASEQLEGPQGNGASNETALLNLSRSPRSRTLKMVAIGDEDVGKSTLLLLWTCKFRCTFPTDYVPTETDDCLSIVLHSTDGGTLNIYLWDMSGAKDFDRMRPENYRDTDAFLACFSPIKPASFESVRARWQPEVRRHCHDTPIVLVGTKLDLRNDRDRVERLKRKGLAPITRRQGRQMAEEIGAVEYLECSALTKEGAKKVLDRSIEVALMQQERDERQLEIGEEAVDIQSADYYIYPANDDDYSDAHFFEEAAAAASASTAPPVPRPRAMRRPPIPVLACPTPQSLREEAKGIAETVGSLRPVVSSAAALYPTGGEEEEIPRAREPRIRRRSNSVLQLAAAASPPVPKLRHSTIRTTAEDPNTGAESLMENGSSSQLDLSLEDDFFKVTSPQGLCLVINIDKYEGDSFQRADRLGSEKDVERVRAVFGKLNFEVRVECNLSCHEIAVLLSRVAMFEDLSNHGCFVCFIMAHGSDGVIYGSDGEALEIESIKEKFRANQCKQLRHKPKLFFIQACRGTQSYSERPNAVDKQYSASDKLYCPKDSDFLLCYPNTEKYEAYRDEINGSPFVQTLCDVIEERYATEDILGMMTRVNGRLKKTPVRAGAAELYAVPQMVSQLSKKCFLDPGRASL